MRLAVAFFTCALSSPAWALKEGSPGQLDPHMVTAPYEVGQVYAAHVPQGQTLAIMLSEDEQATDGFGADKTLLRADLSGNVVLLEAGSTPVAPRTLFIRSRTLDGTKSRTYTMLVDTKPPPEAQTSFTFTYPDDDAAKRRAAWKAYTARREEKLTLAALANEKAEADRNSHYVLQGKTAADWDLLPTRHVSDNGTDTHFWFPGNMRVPVIYAVNPDGKEAVVEPTFNSRTGVATVHQLGRMFRLRDGDALLCVFNRAFDAVGIRSETGTSSQNVERVTQ